MQLDSSQTRREFLITTGAGVVAVNTAIHAAAIPSGQASGKFPALAQVGETFRFVILADPQLGHADDTHRVAANARRTLIQAVQEINAMEPQPAFVVFLGDLVNKFDAKSVANFEECIHDLTAQRVIVHGNHDTHPPYTEFRELMQRHCGFDDVFYSFDTGPWHFVVLPCNLESNTPEQREVEANMLSWLEQDLVANAQRPTVVFEHLHTLPIGLAQTEWYTFPLPLRQKLMALYLRHGNVRWYFNGHVHNGFEASVKTSWAYRGVNFVNCPTIIEMRNFGEESPEFAKGIEEAGYYLLATVKGECMSLLGCRAGQPERFRYPNAFRPFEEKFEPRWWTPLLGWQPQPALVNPAFASALEGWHTTYRYPCDVEPGSEVRTEPAGVHIVTRSKVSHFWANDEYTEMYQLVSAVGDNPVIQASYTLDEVPSSGGGYVRVAGMNKEGLQCHMMWHWGLQENKADYFPRCLSYMIDGVNAGWNYLNDLAAARRGLAWKLSNTQGTHELRADITSVFDEATGTPGAYAALQVDRLLVAAGTWVNKDDGAQSAVLFHRLDLQAGNAAADGSFHFSNGNREALATDASVYTIGFAADLVARTQKRERNNLPS